MRTFRPRKRAADACSARRRRKKTTPKPGIVYRGEHCFVILNAYPYTPGHVMVVPYAHLDELRKLPGDAAHEMIDLSQRMESVLRELYRPDGINLGMNIGKAAGAGIAGHIHMHVLPRWVADANFVSVVGETRILPETLDVTWKRMHAAMETALEIDCGSPAPVNRFASFSISFSSITGTPNSFALSSFEPASEPATT